MNSSEGQQERILRTFTRLYSLRQDWGGALIVGLGLHPEGAALAVASNIAGAVCLCLEDDAAHIKDVIRTGACDFIVNTLDEALRTIKNEIRKRLPLSVGLQADPAAMLTELLERGVSPELVCMLQGDSAESESAARFQSLGAAVLNFGDATGPFLMDPANQLGTVPQPRPWHLRSFTFESAAALRVFESNALSLLPADETGVRRIWLRAAPRILQRERPLRRVLWLTAEEERSLDDMKQ